MKYICLFVYFTIVVNASSNSLDFSVNNILSYIEENFKINQLYSRSQLLIKNGTSSDPQLLWELMGLNTYTKGFLSRKEGVKPKVHFLVSNEDNHKFKCYLNDDSIKYCEITFTKLVLGNKNGVTETINALNSMLSHSELCVAKDERNKSKLFINTLCKGEQGNLEIAVAYKPGQSNRALIELKLIPEG
tara:strand:+ start:69 stop:635 length:567 start_codon:yes stop_codon:yes gene_type:complete